MQQCFNLMLHLCEIMKSEVNNFPCENMPTQQVLLATSFLINEGNVVHQDLRTFLTFTPPPTFF